MKTHFGTLLSRTEIVLGTWSQIPAPQIIDLIGLNGFKFAIIDCEHGHFGLETAENLSRACDAADIASVLRLPANDPVLIMKALDAGISHVVVPNIASAAMARMAVEATRFAPHGRRGACPCCRSNGHYTRNWQEYALLEEQRVGVTVLIESEDGVDRIDEILAVEGLAAVMFGPFDLSVSMGFHGDWQARPVMDAIHHMIDQTVAKGHPVIMPVFDATPSGCRELIEHYHTLGVSTFVVGSDKIILANAMQEWGSIGIR